MKKNNSIRYFAIFMLALITIFAIAMIVTGGIVFKHVIIDKQFWFDLSDLGLTAQNSIMLFTGYVGGGGLIFAGIGTLINIIGTEKISRILDILMD